MGLPTVAERMDLARETARLIARGGVEPYVAALLVEPTPQFFPDPWAATDVGVEQVARRVLDYAGLAAVAARVTMAGPDDEIEAPGAMLTAVAADAIDLTIDVRRLDDPLGLLALLARAAAQVFRLQHDLRGETDEVERRYIDVTATYLGFGVITTNAAYRYRASGEMIGYDAITEWAHRTFGELSAGAQAWLLAMQVTARGASGGVRRAIARQLETNQATWFTEACAELAKAPVPIAGELGLPPATDWPAPRPAPPRVTGAAARAVRELAGNGTAGDLVPTARAVAGAGHNAGLAVFRAGATRAWLGAGLSVAVAFVAVMIASLMELGGLALAMLVGLPLLGGLAGSRFHRDICAGARCGGTLRPGVTRCPHCGGTIAGALLPGETRLDAEERLGLNDD